MIADFIVGKNARYHSLWSLKLEYDLHANIIYYVETKNFTQIVLKIKCILQRWFSY